MYYNYYYHYNYNNPRKFFTLALTGGLSRVFEWSQVLQVTRIRLNILADLKNAGEWIVSIFYPITNSSDFFCNRLGTIRSVAIKIGIAATLMFHCILSSLTSCN